MVADNPQPILLAIVEVDKTERVYCAQPGCNHTVYKAIHVVRDAGELLVLGSTCYAKRYGGDGALGKAQHWGGNGKVLSTHERELLVGNTEALLAFFAAEEARLREEAALKLKRLQENANRAPLTTPLTVHRPLPGMRVPVVHTQRRPPPWDWMKANTSVAAFKLSDGSGWVRLQHKDGRQLIVPWPTFEGWDESMPPVVGRPNLELGGYEAGNVGDAIAYLRARSTWEKITGVWGEVTAVLGSTP